MKNIFLSIVYCLLFIGFFSCKEIQPVTMGGVENPRLKSLSKEGIEFDFAMKIKNPNKMRIIVFPSSFDATLNGTNAGKVRLAKRVKIKANSDETSEFHIKSDFSKLGFADMASIIPIVTSKRVDLGLKGNVRVGKWYYKKKFPIELRKTIPLSK